MPQDFANDQKSNTIAGSFSIQKTGYFRVDILRDTIECTPAFAAIMTGDASRINLSRQDLVKHIYHEDLDVRNRAMAAAESTGDFGATIRIVHTGGMMRRVLIEGAFFRDESGQPVSLVGTATDITDQSDEVKDLKDVESHFRTIVEQAPLAIALLSGPDLIVSRANEYVLRIWGKDESILFMPLRQALPEIHGQGFFELLDQVYTSGKPYYGFGVLAKLAHKDGLRDVYFDFVYTPTRDGDGQISGVMVLASEVTDQIQSRRQLEESEQQMRSVVDNAPFPIGVYIGREMRIQLANKSIMDIWGKGYEVTGKLYSEVLPEVGQAIYDQLDHVYVTGEAFHTKNTNINLLVNGELKHFYFNYSFTPLYDTAGKIYGVMNTGADVTDINIANKKLEDAEQQLSREVDARTSELTAANEELNEANMRLQHSNEELEQYAYVTSHDLQEPLRKIMLYAGMLEDPNTKPLSGKELAAKIGAAAKRMSLLIGDLLNFSRLMHGEALMKPVDTAQILRSVVGDYELMIEEKNAVIEAGDMPVIEATSLQVNQLFYNLIGNALKFTMPDRQPVIRISAQKLERKELLQYIAKPLPYTYYMISVADNGIGFESKFKEQIFEVFKRLHSKDLYPGSGIGLALCKRIVANHRGHLSVDSEPGQGATFHIILPEKQHTDKSTLPENFTWNI